MIKNKGLVRLTKQSGPRPWPEMFKVGGAPTENLQPSQMNQDEKHSHPSDGQLINSENVTIFIFFHEPSFPYFLSTQNIVFPWFLHTQNIIFPYSKKNSSTFPPFHAKKRLTKLQTKKCRKSISFLALLFQQIFVF